MNPVNIYIRPQKYTYRYILSMEVVHSAAIIVKGYRAGKPFHDWRGIRLRPIALPELGIIINAMI